jgi:hypothetical protein
MCSLLLVIPTVAWAQATITGTAKDTSGAVLPGVVVEATSPALIERLRSVVTDATGQYRIVDLRPGTYTVTFTLPGFSTVKREGVELSGAFVANINAEMPVGTLETAVTVTGETPIVDVKSARREQVVDHDLLTSIPSARTYQTMVALAPGVTTTGGQDVGGLNSPATRAFGIHGGPATEGRVMVDGMNAGGARGGAGVSNYQVDVGNAQELTYTLSGGLGEAETGGPTMNVVPKTGGNTWRYDLQDRSASNVQHLLSDAAVEDTHGIDRETAQLASGGLKDELLFGTASCARTGTLSNMVADRPGGDVVLVSEAPVDGLVFMSEPYYVERVAFVDDVPVKSIKANVAFTAVPVPAGRHTIELRYVPRLFRAGVGVSLATLGVWVVAAGRIRLKWRSSSNEPGAR